jgi:hypothetical protein
MLFGASFHQSGPLATSIVDPPGDKKTARHPTMRPRMAGLNFQGTIWKTSFPQERTVNQSGGFAACNSRLAIELKKVECNG